MKKEFEKILQENGETVLAFLILFEIVATPILLFVGVWILEKFF